MLTFLHTSDQGLNKVCVLGSAQCEFDIGLVNSCNWGNLSRDAPMMKVIYKIPWIQSVQVNWFFGRTEPAYILMSICLPWHTIKVYTHYTTLSIINLTKSNCWKRQCWQDLKRHYIYNVVIGSATGPINIHFPFFNQLWNSSRRFNSLAFSQIYAYISQLTFKPRIAL